jgi:hypothetical protein
MPVLDEDQMKARGLVNKPVGQDDDEGQDDDDDDDDDEQDDNAKKPAASKPAAKQVAVSCCFVSFFDHCLMFVTFQIGSTSGCTSTKRFDRFG